MLINIKNSIKIFLILIFIILNLKIFYVENNIIKNFKVCLCTVGKKENLYAREYIEHYKNYGVDKIFLYDNNDKNGEKFEDVILDYINAGFVQIINYRGLLSPQNQAYKNCHENNYKKYNWLIFFDMDEFIFLKNFENIKYFLKKKIYNKCERIQLNFLFHTDNNLLYYDNRSIKERFPIREKKARGKKRGGYSVIKSIVKGNITIPYIDDPHTISHKLITCDGFGKIKTIENITTKISDFYYYYIIHYFSKSTEEFIKKIMRGSAYHGFKIEKKIARIREYFSVNDITLEKINFIENETKINCSIYRNKINYNL